MILSPLQYPGGKFHAVKQLACFIPQKTTEIVSPFLGGASFEIYLTKFNITVHGADALQPLINCWYHILKHPQKVAKQVETYLPMSKTKAYQIRKDYDSLPPKSIEAAAAFYTLNRVSYSGLTLTRFGYSKRSGKRFNSKLLDKLSQFKCPKLKVKHQDFQKTIANNPNKLLYCDPPYIVECGLYTHNKGSANIFDHHKLQNLLSKHKNKWILSYNDCEEIRNLYKNYYIFPTSWAYGMKNKQTQGKELIITNFKRPWPHIG